MSLLKLRRILLLSGLLSTAILWAAPVRAQARLSPPTKSQVDAARMMFNRGVVVVIEPNKSGGLAQVTLFGRINAPQKTVYDIVSDPNMLPPMQPGMRDIKVRAQRGNAITYSWTYGDVITRIDGVWSLALAPPQAVSLRSMSGFGPGFVLCRFFSDSPDQTTVAIAMNLDVTKSNNAILRWLTNANPDFQQAWNLGYSVMWFRGLEQIAVKRAGTGKAPPPTGRSGVGPLRPLTPNQAKKLRPLLKRGTVAVIESDRQGRVAQASLAELVKAPPATVQKALNDPGRWSSFIKSVEIDDVQANPEGHTFKIGFSFVAFTLGTDINLRRLPDGADLTSPSGSLHRSAVSWRHAQDGSNTILTTTGRIRFRQGGRIIRRMIDNDPYFGHALNASALTVFSRSLKLRAEGLR